MKISEMNWQQLENWLQKDDRAILPLGSTEQHAFLSLSVDSILAEKVAEDAAAHSGIPVFPVLPFGMTPAFTAFPGTVHIRIETYRRLLVDMLDSLKRQGFRRILLVNGHGGNMPAQNIALEWVMDNPDMKVQLHNWWCAPATWKKVMETDPIASHASWMENFPWTRLPGVVQPAEQKPMMDLSYLRTLPPEEVKRILQEGNYGGFYQRSDEEMLAIWQVAVKETRTLIDNL